MRIKKDTVVAISYTLRKNDENGEIIEVCTAENALKFIFGAGSLLPKFEENLLNLEAGDDFDFALAPEDAYGNRTDEAIVEVPMGVFNINGEIKKDILFEGNSIPMRDANGNPMMGKVVRVDESKAVVVMDFNHPLADTDLFFTGKVESVREATEDEKANGLRRRCGGCGGHKNHGDEGGCCGGGNDCGGGCGDSGNDSCCGGCH